MPWTRLDDDFHSNPKTLAMGLDGAGLYARALSYCGDYITDGFIPRTWIEQAAGRRKQLLVRLETVGAWRPVNAGEEITVVDSSTNHVRVVCKERGYFIDGYVEINPSSVELAVRREKKVSAGRKGATKRWGDSTRHTTSHSSGIAPASENGWQDDGKAIARAHTRARDPNPESLDEGFVNADDPSAHARVAANTKRKAVDDTPVGDSPRHYTPTAGEALVRNALWDDPHVADALRDHFADIDDDEVIRLVDLAADLAHAVVPTREKKPEEGA